MATNSPLPAAHRPKTIQDLPNEVLVRICEYLVPHRSEIKPFTDSELRLRCVEQQVEGATEYGQCRILHQRDEYSLYSSDLFSPIFDPHKLNLISVWLHKNEEKADFPNHFANFASTCKSINSQACYIASRHSFSLMISNAGITFEGIRDATPLQVFGDSETYVMVENHEMKMQIVPEGSVPGNTAFAAFTQAMGNMTKLGLEIKIDLAPKGFGRTKFFIEQVASQLTALRGQGSHLSNVTVTIVLGFWSTERDGYAQHPELIHRSVSATRLDLRRCMFGTEDKTFAEVAAEIAASVLQPLAQVLRGNPTAQTHPRSHLGSLGSMDAQSEAGMRLVVKWGDPNLSKVLKSAEFIGHPWNPVPREWASRKLLRKKLEEQLDGSAAGKELLESH